MTKNILIILMIVLLIVCAPIATIVAINTLFGTSISVNLYTWMSALWLGGLVGGGAKAASK
jgi:hypothetical protein